MSTADENIEAVKTMILGNRRIPVREVVDDVGISFGSCQAIFCEYFRQETCGSDDCSKIVKFWTKTKSHGHRSLDVDDIQRRSLLKKIITAGKSRVYGYDIETKAQS